MIGHVPDGVPLEESGIDDIQHLIGIPEIASSLSLGNPMVDGWRDLSRDRVDQVVEHSLNNDVVHTPTLVFHWTNSIRDRHNELIDQTSSQLLPRLFRDVAWKPQAAIRLGGTRTPEMQAALRASYHEALDVVGQLHRRGVVIQAGTDTANPFVIQGAALVQEVSLLVEAGLTNEEALAAATNVPARYLDVPLLGRLVEGAPADLLVLNADPVSNLDALDDIHAVVASGHFYSIELLNSQIDRYQRHHKSITWDTILPMVARLLR